MALGAIRSRFIRLHLEHALTTEDLSYASKVASEFRRYFEWFAGSLEEPDRELISGQLRRLEESCRNKQTQPAIKATPPVVSGAACARGTQPSRGDVRPILARPSEIPGRETMSR